MKILLNIFSAIISYLLFILSFCGFFLFFLYIIGETSNNTYILFAVILWAFFIWITFSILYSFQKRIRDYIDSNYMVSLGMTFDLLIYLFPLTQKGVILFPETDSITLLIIICISIIILLYAMGILIMKNIYSKYRKKYPIQLDNTEKIFKD